MAKAQKPRKLNKQQREKQRRLSKAAHVKRAREWWGKLTNAQRAVLLAQRQAQKAEKREARLAEQLELERLMARHLDEDVEPRLVKKPEGVAHE